jgi:hypothetical protein
MKGELVRLNINIKRSIDATGRLYMILEKIRNLRKFKAVLSNAEHNYSLSPDRTITSLNLASPDINKKATSQ